MTNFAQIQSYDMSREHKIFLNALRLLCYIGKVSKVNDYYKKLLDKVALEISPLSHSVMDDFNDSIQKLVALHTNK